MKKRIICSLLCFCLMLGMLCGCSNNTETEETPAEEAAEKITVACMNTYAPYAYVDEEENVAGFDVEVMKEAAARCGYEIEFVATDWDSLFPGLDSGKWDVVANQICFTEERDELYNMGKVPYVTSCMQLVVKADNNDVTSIEEMNGGKMAAIVGDYGTALLEGYLEENPGAFELVYSESTMAMLLEDIVNGRVIGNVNDPASITMAAEANGLADQVKIVGDPIYTDYVYAAYQKTDKGAEIRDNMDAAIKTMIEDGFISELALEYIGVDNNATLLDGIRE